MIGLIIIRSSCVQLLLVKWSIAPYVRAHRFKEPINTSQSRNALCFTVLLHCVVVNVRLPGVSLSGVQNSAPVALSSTGTKIAIHYLRTRFSQGIEVSELLLMVVVVVLTLVNIKLTAKITAASTTTTTVLRLEVLN